MERISSRVLTKASELVRLARSSLALVALSLPFCILVLLAGAQQHDTSPNSAASKTLISGKRLFGTNCAGCHGLDARGGEHAPNIATNPELQRMSDAELFRIVHDGAASGTMPAFGSILSTSEIRSVVVYLRSLQGRSGGTHDALPGDPVAGKSLFFGKAACAQCHTIEGSGGFIASDLTSYAAAGQAAEILRAITNPDENPNPRSRTNVIVMRDGQQLTGLIRNQDNFSIQLQSLDGRFYLLQRTAVASVTTAPQSLMPEDYSQRFTPAQLNDLVSFLMRVASAEPASGHRDKKGHNGEDDE